MDECPCQKDPHNSPMSVYEVHLGSWRLGLGYKELAKELVEYVKWLGFSHVEFMPVAEHPFGGSWGGYQVTSYFAPTSRFGHPDEFRFLVDSLHQAGIGVLLDWVPAHFPPKDSWALAQFDGQPLYEHSDPRPGRTPRLGNLDLRLRTQRGPQLPGGQRPVLAGGIPHRRPARGCRCSMIYLDYSREEGSGGPTSSAAARTSKLFPSCRKSTPPSTSPTQAPSSSPRNPRPSPVSRRPPTTAGWASASNGTWLDA